MSFIPSWTHDMYPRLCSKCGLDCRREPTKEKPHRNMYHRIICRGCFKFFCDTCADEHGAENYTKPATDPAGCGKCAADHDHLLDEDTSMPGWKVAFVQSILPNAVLTDHSVHTSGWDLRFFLSLTEDDNVIHREQLEVLCEGLHASWMMCPAAALPPTYQVRVSGDPGIKYPIRKIPHPPPPEGCETGIMIYLEYVRA